MLLDLLCLQITVSSRGTQAGRAPLPAVCFCFGNVLPCAPFVVFSCVTLAQVAFDS